MGHLSGPYHLVPAHYINIGCISLKDRSLLDEVCLVFDPCKSWPKIDNMSKKIWTGQAGWRLPTWGILAHLLAFLFGLWTQSNVKILSLPKVTKWKSHLCVWGVFFSNCNINGFLLDPEWALTCSISPNLHSTQWLVDTARRVFAQ